MKVNLFEEWLFLILAFVFGIVGFLVPYVPVKVVTVFGAIVSVGFLLKHYTGKMAGFIALSVIFFLIPVAGVTSVEYLVKNGHTNFFTDIIESNLKNWEFSNLSERKFYNFDKTIDGSESIKVDIDGKAVISFVDGSKIKYPSVLSVNRVGKRVEIHGGDKKSTYTLQLGISNVQVIDVSAVDLEISGKLNTIKTNFSGVSIKMNGDFEADEIGIDGAGVELDGNFSSKRMITDGVGITLKGSYNVNYFELSGVGITMDMKLSNCENFEISGTGIDGTLTYVGGKKLTLNVDGVGGTLKFKNLAQEPVSVQSNGVKVVRE